MAGLPRLAERDVIKNIKRNSEIKFMNKRRPKRKKKRKIINK